MNDYSVVQVTEAELEELVKLAPGKIEEGMKFIAHQVQTERGPLDVLLLDSEKALVVAELKVVEDDGMLIQGLDYYDYVQRNLSAFALAYHKHGVDASKEPRLFLVAPSFSTTLRNRARWLNLPLSLFTFQCIELEAPAKQRIVVYSEIALDETPPPYEAPTLDGHLAYMASDSLRELVRRLVREAGSWSGEATFEPRKKYVAVRRSNHYMGQIYCHKSKFVVAGLDKTGKWVWHGVKGEEDFQGAVDLFKSSFDQVGA